MDYDKNMSILTGFVYSSLLFAGSLAVSAILPEIPILVGSVGVLSGLKKLAGL